MMALFSGIRRVLRLGVWRRELDEELGYHFDRTVEELVANGVPPREAAEEARRRFGDERRWRRELERIDGWAASRRKWGARLEVVGGSVRLAVRRIARSPGFAAGVVLTFALGIGANATMYGIVDRMLLRPPAHIVDAERVKRIWVDRGDLLRHTRTVAEVMNYPQYRDLLPARGFSGVAAYSSRELTVGRGESAMRLRGGLVTGNFFSVLGVGPEVGRVLVASDDRLEAPRVAVLSREAWRRHYGGRADVIGSTIDFGAGPYTVVGVAPPGFTGVELTPIDLWLPLVPTATGLQDAEWMEHRGWNFIELIARLAPGVTPEAAAAEATLLHRAGQSEQIEDGSYDPGATVVTGAVVAGRGPTESPESLVAKWLVGISMIVLLIACANVANLLLARSIQQRREIGIRLALGSSRGRVLAQTITESLLLALLGGVAALGVSLVGGAALRRAIFPNISFSGTGMEGRTAAVVALLAVVAGVASALIPALQTSRPALQDALKSGSRSATAPGSRTRSLLTVLQAALSVLLLVGAGLFLRSLHGARTLDLGLDARGVLFFQPVFAGTPTQPAEREFYRRATERLQALPEVEGVAGDVSIPFWSSIATDLRVPGLDSIPTLASGSPILHEVGRDYFDVLRIRTVRGRAFEPGDTEGAPRVAVVNETMARVLWPGKEAIGECLIIGYDPSEEGAVEPPCATVVGVVEDARRFELEEAGGMQYYVPLEQNTREMSPFGLLVRARGDEAAATAAIRREMLALDPSVRYADVRPLQDLIDPLARSWRLGAVVLTVFGALALLVAGIGLYSVLAFSVLQRTFELGIRAAIGATRQRLVALVLGQAFRLVGTGIALGLVVAILAGPRLEPLLFRVSSRDPVTLVFVAAALALVALLAAAWPAWRATRVDPSVALRAE